MIERCGGQIRVGIGGAFAIDFTAILLMAAAMGANSMLLADLLPEIEPVIVAAYRDGGDNGNA